MLRKNEKIGQVWIETVIYTLIGLVLIATVLAIALPIIEEQRDKRVIESTIDALNTIDNKILEIKQMGPSNKREIDFYIRKGRLLIIADSDLNEEGDKLVFEIDESEYVASEPGRLIELPGTNLKIKTEAVGERYNIVISREYNPEVFDLTINGEDSSYTFNTAPTPYKLIVENKGNIIGNNKLNINIYSLS